MPDLLLNLLRPPNSSGEWRNSAFALLQVLRSNSSPFGLNLNGLFATSLGLTGSGRQQQKQEQPLPFSSS